MNKKETVNFIFLAEKYKGKTDNDILLAVAENEVSGKVVDISSFIYSIGKEENIVPIGRLWNYLCEQAKGKTEGDYLNSLNKLVEKYSFPEQFFPQLLYENPEDGSLHYYLTGDLAL